MAKKENLYKEIGYKTKSHGKITRDVVIYWYILKNNPDLLASLLLSDKLFVSPRSTGEKAYPNKNIKVYQFIKKIYYISSKSERKQKNLKTLIKNTSSSNKLINDILDVLDKDKNNLYLFSITSHFDRILNNSDCELKADDYKVFIEKFVLYAKNRIYKNNQSKIKKLNLVTLIISILSIIIAATIGIFEIITK